jgi:hypothetical protein
MENESEKVHNYDCQNCIHHWMIDERNLGVCKKCGAIRQFSRSWNPLSSHGAWSNKPNKAQPDVSGTQS